MVNLTFFVPHIKKHTSTKFQVSKSKNAELQKQNFRKMLAKKMLLKHFCRIFLRFTYGLGVVRMHVIYK